MRIFKSYKKASTGLVAGIPAVIIVHGWDITLLLAASTGGLDSFYRGVGEDPAFCCPAAREIVDG
jgi:hypothetical protein